MDTLTSRFTNCSDTEGIGFYYTYNGKGKLVRIEMKSVTIADGEVTGRTLLSQESYLYGNSEVAYQKKHIVQGRRFFLRPYTIALT